MKSHSGAEKSQYSTDQKETYQGFQARLLDALVRDVIHVMRAPFSLHNVRPLFSGAQIPCLKGLPSTKFTNMVPEGNNCRRPG